MIGKNAMELSSGIVTEYTQRITRTLNYWQFGNKAQLAFLEDLSLLINDGIPANRAIELMSQATQGLSREVALSIANKIAEGQPLAEGMMDWFAPNAVEIIRVGESGGALAQTIQSAINMLSQQEIAMSAFISAVSYPLLVFSIACIVIIYLNNSVLTQFQLIKPMDQWPEAGRRLVSLGSLIKNGWWLAIFMVIAAIIFFRRMLVNFTDEIRSLLDTVPPFSLYRRLVAARVLETLGLLVANGVVFKSAIKIMQYQANPYTLSHLRKMEHLLSMGKTNIADVLDTGLIDANNLMRLRVMAEVKGFEHGLMRMGVRGTQQATATLKLIARMTGGALLVLGGLMIIIIIQGIYMTGMSLGS